MKLSFDLLKSHQAATHYQSFNSDGARACASWMALLPYVQSQKALHTRNFSVAIYVFVSLWNDWATYVYSYYLIWAFMTRLQEFAAKNDKSKLCQVLMKTVSKK